MGTTRRTLRKSGSRPGKKAAKSGPIVVPKSPVESSDFGPILLSDDTSRARIVDVTEQFEDQVIMIIGGMPVAAIELPIDDEPVAEPVLDAEKSTHRRSRVRTPRNRRRH